MAESHCCLHETITVLLLRYHQYKIKSFLKKLQISKTETTELGTSLRATGSLKGKEAT